MYCGYGSRIAACGGFRDDNRRGFCSRPPPCEKHLMLARTNGHDVRMAVDIGGTFTDIVLDRGAERLTRKVLTTAQRPEEGVLDGARLVLGDAGLHFSDIDVFIHGTTLATRS